MAVERFSQVMHIVSTVEGELRERFEPLDALAVTFPAGTVTGAPKRRAMEMIAERRADRPRARTPARSGTCTFAGDLDVCITIRTAVVSGGLAHVQSGCGIVDDSDPAAELRETKAKAAACFRGPGGAVDGRGLGMILVVDHYDSFVYNLVQLVERLGPSTEVVRSDAESAEHAGPRSRTR